VLAAEEEANKEESRLLAEGKKAKEEFTALEARLKQVREERAGADQEAASARALAEHARQLADEFKQLSGEKTCRVCGQILTPEHFDSERKRRDLDAKAAERKFQDLIAIATSAQKIDAEMGKKETAERKHLDDLRDQYKDALSTAKQAAQDIKRLTDSCRQSYFALPDEFKAKIGPREPEDWSKVTYPDRHDISTLSEEARQIDAVKRKLRTAQDEAKKVGELRAKLESARERMEKARRSLPPGNPALVRQEFADKQAEEKSVAASIAATKQAIHAAELDVETTQRDLANIDLQLTTLTGNLETEEQSRKQSAEAIERARKSLPQAWQMEVETAGIADRAKWQDELDALTASGTEKKFTTLQAARAGLDSLRAEVKQCEEELAQFPEESRRNPEEVKAEVLAERKELDTRNKELLDAQRAKGILDDYRTQRRELGDRYKAVDAEHNRYKLLAELLGRDRLQRFLVRTAEKQIVDYANAVLDRISSGQLFLKLVGSDDNMEKALELECANRLTGTGAINVAFLSGSQRFRVAVALALGIGQYASKQHRPIESVIIDEGFGCLDRAGRQVMIQEMQNLRGQLQCILLVSHQEEFAEAFPDGYRFELRDGTTKVTRIVR
ncbi:MAG TPA: SMC family ATPase, partial [Gemmata sp.]|nr:SMC family ATPase [Gemmata sp.]